MIAIAGGTVLTPSQRFDPGVVLIEGDQIQEVGPEADIRIPSDAGRIDASERYVCPGLIDLHTHGVLGHDVMGDELAAAIGAYPQFGVTSFLATTTTVPSKTLQTSLGRMASILNQPPDGASCLGIHLEGPHLSPAQPGMANAELFEPLTWAAFEKLQQKGDGHISMITLAPERLHSMRILGQLHDVGVLPVAGHTDATFEQMAAAVDAGLNHATHTYNAMRPFHHREPGAVGAVLHFEPIYAQLIADGVHVHPAAVDILLRTKGSERIVLISDSAPVAGLPDGAYDWRDWSIHVIDGRCQLSDGTLAGSAATLDAGLRFLTQSLRLPIELALEMATTTPAQALGLQAKGELAPGMDADLTLLDRSYEPVLTMVRGTVCWQAE